MSSDIYEFESENAVEIAKAALAGVDTEDITGIKLEITRNGGSVEANPTLDFSEPEKTILHALKESDKRLSRKDLEDKLALERKEVNNVINVFKFRDWLIESTRPTGASGGWCYVYEPNHRALQALESIESE